MEERHRCEDALGTPAVEVGDEPRVVRDAAMMQPRSLRIAGRSGRVLDLRRQLVPVAITDLA